MNIVGTSVAVALAVVVGLGFLFLGPSVLRPFQSAGTAPAAAELGATTESNPSTMSIPAELPTELTLTDEVVGSGAEAKSGSTVTVNYVGMLPDGTVFDASAKHGQAFTFQLGAGQVIAGWDNGFVGMKVGGKRQLIIPANMAYGDRGVPGVIPGGATLIFDVELLDVK